MSAFFERVRAALAPKGYEVLEELGRGGMGTVFLARQRSLDQLVAVKVLRQELYTARAAQRFVEEARTLAALPDHTQIVAVLDVGETDGLSYYVMEYVRGETLAERLRKGSLPSAEALKLGRDLLEALEVAHTAGVVHRDVKPANVFWNGKKALLVDFGIAKRRPSRDSDSPPASGPSTEPGGREGTPDYMAPEQFAPGAEPSPLSDLYSAALVVYEAYTARHWHDARGGHRQWQGVPAPVVPVLRKALEPSPGDRWRDARTFKQKLWRTRARKFRLRTLWLTAGGVVVGAVLALWLLERWQTNKWPFRPPTALHVVVAPLENICAPADGGPEHVARALVRDLQGYLDFSAAGPRAPPSLARRSTVVVRGTVCGRGDSLRVEVRLQIGLAAADPAAIVARNDTGHIDLLADTLAYGVVREIWNRENPLDPVLPRAALPRQARGIAAWLAAERLLAEGRWGEADRAYDEAEAIDPTCWLCAWRHADVDKWLGRPFDVGRAARYMSHIDSFPPHYRRLISASGRPFARRLETLIPLARERRDFLPAQFMLADELYHRGPLIGHLRRDAIAAFDRVVGLRPDFMPAWEHLAWVLAADGREARAKEAFARLEASGPARDPFSREVRALLELGLACRFDGTVVCRRTLDRVLPAAGDYPDLAAGPRYLMTFDAPRGAVEFGARFAKQGDQPALQTSGLVAEVSGYVALGRVDSARAAARALRDRGASAALDVFAGELDGALLLLDPPPDAGAARARWADVATALTDHVRSRVSTDTTRRRAAWLLLLLSRRFGGGLPDAARYERLLAGEPAPRPLGRLLDADATALRGRLDDALAATDSLTMLQADSLGDPASADPFFRTVLHLLRAAWYERRRDVSSAVAELGWYENNDVFERPSGLPQVADVDWAFGTLARWRIARLRDARGDRDEQCREYGAVRTMWAAADAPFGARADSAAGRLAALGCKAPA